VDDAVLMYLQKLISKEKLSVPKWIVDFYAANNSLLPDALSFVHHNEIDDKIANGWYRRIKLSSVRK